MKEESGIDEPTFDEVLEIIKRSKNGKTAGSDEISMEFIKCGGKNYTQNSTN